MSKNSLQSFFTAFDAALQSVEGQQKKETSAGIVRSAKDGVVHIYGLLDLAVGEVVRIQEANIDALVKVAMRTLCNYNQAWTLRRGRVWSVPVSFWE